MGNDSLVRFLILIIVVLVGMVVIIYSVVMWWAMAETSRHHKKLPEGNLDKKTVTRSTIFLAPISLLIVFVLRMFTGIIKALLLFLALACFPIFLLIAKRKSGIPKDDDKEKEGILVKIGNYILKGIW